MERDLRRQQVQRAAHDLPDHPRQTPRRRSDFPHVVIYDLDGDRNGWEIGTEQYSTYNSLDTDIFEITDDFTFYKGNHEIVVGTHNEFYRFKNLFLSNGFGSYDFDTLDDYYAGIANGYSLTYSNYPESPADEFQLPARLLRRRHLARQAEFHPHLRSPRRHPDLPRQAGVQPGSRRGLRHRHQRSPERQRPVVAAHRLQLGHQR